jgi:transcription antitermination factor NusG
MSAKWYACYTKSRAEKKVAERLNAEGIECYLPLKKERRKWSDRLKVVEFPLFTSYVFVKVEPSDFTRVRQQGDIVQFITFEGKAASIPDDQIEYIKRVLGSNHELELVPSGMKPGQKIEILKGHLMGVKGELIRHQGRHKVLIRLDEIGQGLLITVEAESIGAIVLACTEQY